MALPGAPCTRPCCSTPPTRQVDEGHHAPSPCDLMNVFEQLHARFYDSVTAPMERRGLAERRVRLLEGLEGDVLEIGAGTGANLEAYPEAVTSLTLTEPSAPMAQRLRTHVAAERPDTTVVKAAAEDLPFADASFDGVVSTLVLCSVDDPGVAVSEIRRVLRPAGRLAVLEHVVSSGRGRILQRAWEPAQKVIGRNCHMTRDTRRFLEIAGFDTTRVVDTNIPGLPHTVFPVISGIAAAAD
ncbi:MAG: methyltransferase domain-containing protein [Nitriliruptorales bacterium]|nr:methyltransferase domain-containing protein [Nitriliruptorales bacterium]